MAIETITDYIISGHGTPTSSTVGTAKGKIYKDEDATNGVIYWVCDENLTWHKSAANIHYV